MDEKNDFFYCYSCLLKNFIKSQGVNYIMKGLHSKTKKPFFLFKRDDNLNNILTKWSDIKVK